MHRPAGELGAARTKRVDPSVGGGHDELVAIVPGQIDQQRAGRAVATEVSGPAWKQVLVAVKEQLAAVLGGHRRPATPGGRAHDDPHREGVWQWVWTPVGSLCPAAVVIAVECVPSGGEPRLQRGGV